MIVPCEGFYCLDCPLLELENDDFTNQDRTDGVNSVRLLRSSFREGRRGRFETWETERLEREARATVRYSNQTVSKMAVRALERQITGDCEILTRGE